VIESRAPAKTGAEETKNAATPVASIHLRIAKSSSAGALFFRDVMGTNTTGKVPFAV
jgi:hypothetical protein